MKKSRNREKGVVSCSGSMIKERSIESRSDRSFCPRYCTLSPFKKHILHRRVRSARAEREEKEKKKRARSAARTFPYLLARLGVENAPPPLPPPRLGRFRARAAETRRSGRAATRSAASTRRDASQCVAGFFIDSDGVSCRMLRSSAARARFA